MVGQFLSRLKRGVHGQVDTANVARVQGRQEESSAGGDQAQASKCDGGDEKQS